MTWANAINTDENNLGGKPSDWDKVKIGGVDWPGVAQVTFTAPPGLDIQKPKGGKRATVIDNGDPPIEINIKLTLLPEDFDDFQKNCIPIIRNRSKTKGRDPLDFVHPQGQLWGVQNIIIGNCTTPPPEPGGAMIVSIKAYEWVPAPKPVKKTKPKIKGPTDLSGQALLPPPVFLPTIGSPGEESFSAAKFKRDADVSDYRSWANEQPTETVIDPYSSDDPDAF